MGGGFYSHHRCSCRPVRRRALAAEAVRAVGSRVEAGAAPRGPRVSNPRVSLEPCGPLDLADPTVVMRRLMSSSHYELSLEKMIHQMMDSGNKQKKLEKKLLNEDDHAVHLLIPTIGSEVPTESDQIIQRTLPEDAMDIHLPNSMIGFIKPDQITQRILPEDAMNIHLPNSMLGSVQPDQITQRTLPEDAIDIHLPNSMIGFIKPDQITQRTLPEDAMNIHLPNSMLDQITQRLPEDAMNIHLPNSMLGSVQPDQITQRTLPEDAIDIHLPNSMIDQITQRTLPEDAIDIHLPNSMIDQITQRTLPEDAIDIHLPNSMIGSAKLTERICKAFEAYDNETPSIVQNAAKITFYRLGIFLKTDVQELNGDRLEQLMSRFSGFDLVVGSIPCNNLDVHGFKMVFNSNPSFGYKMPLRVFT
ncbi:hypothetical protein F3Y22_tig00110831pilonHSYRG00115 [Hibiscus syriacus]|uniref:Uncharacterized protein n=1 Tax=Hibiscus syriacus TaxID=106335 RepID=A0A6A2ZM94_HIBSY|nr:hypothetical protein F3Y22_tig00110831pilonHSYRG00115 [Hibiscus syriacus]